MSFEKKYWIHHDKAKDSLQVLTGNSSIYHELSNRCLALMLLSWKGGRGGALYTYKFYLSLRIGLIRIKTCVAASDQKVVTQWLNDFFFFSIVTKNFKLCSFQILILISYRLGGEEKKENYTRRNIHKKYYKCDYGCTQAEKEKWDLLGIYAHS